MAPDEERYPGDDTDPLLTKFQRWERDIEAHLSEWRREARDCFDLVAGEQWKQEDADRLDDLGKPHVTFNRIAPVIDAVSGAEITGRQQVAYLPRQVGASAVNEVLTKGAEFIRDRCDAEHEESDAARDTFICGLGCTETRIDYEDDPNGQIKIERIDPLEMGYDPGSRKTNLADARFIRRRKPLSREEFEELFPGADPDGTADADGLKRPTVVDPEIRYTNGDGDESDQEDVVYVSEWQWFEREPYYRVAHPDTGEVAEVDPEQYEPIAAQSRAMGVELGGVRQVRRVYYRAFVAADDVLHHERIQADQFTYNFMTGKRDRNKGVWYGLVRPMSDPQKFANKFYSQILHILNSNAKGGIAMETAAVDDIRQFEDSWSKADAITWVKDLTDANGKPRWIQKNPPQYPEGSDRLMQYAVTAIRDSTGVNQELLGLADRDQPGVIEAHRKQAAYGILSSFFDGFKRYRKINGRLLLRMMQLFITPDTLVRIVGDDGTAQYVPMALNSQIIEFDVIVDDAPAGPNQKEAAFQMLLQLMPLLQNANLPPEIWAEFVRYSPLPNALAEKLIQALMQMQNAPPSPDEQADLALKQSKAQNDAASAKHHDAQATLLLADAAHKSQQDPNADAKADAGKAALDQAQLQLDRAKTGALMAKTVSDIVRDHRPEPTRTP